MAHMIHVKNIGWRDLSFHPSDRRTDPAGRRIGFTNYYVEMDGKCDLSVKIMTA
ncbi:hypothetical protein [Paenibacillus polymyxa]|uniref:hypothetical protein n=1 Tax=Paenibacillus polymyxa TaxID=1406 RepID=UPI002AB51BA0|nr:hypothetical protein [Paenibacillus polymyxa]MDY8024280.1 hypothetical protein [Paenibacillus polymyxa]